MGAGGCFPGGESARSRVMELYLQAVKGSNAEVQKSTYQNSRQRHKFVEMTSNSTKLNQLRELSTVKKCQDTWQATSIISKDVAQCAKKIANTPVFFVQWTFCEEVLIGKEIPTGCRNWSRFSK
jgi:hypothetical protein